MINFHCYPIYWKEKKETEILIMKMFFISVIGYTNDSNLFETFMKESE